MITVYGFSRVNAFAHRRTRELRVLWALEEMGLPYEIKGLDHSAGELNTDAYRALSPFEQVPAIDDDGMVISESAAILLYLAKKSGKLVPADPSGEAQVMRWCFAAVNTVELPMLYVDVLNYVVKSDAGVKQHREAMIQWAHLRLAGLERWLDGREFIATDSFTVADILMSLVLSILDDPSLFEPYPRVRSYRERCKSRPAWKRTFAAHTALSTKRASSSGGTGWPASSPPIECIGPLCRCPWRGPAPCNRAPGHGRSRARGTRSRTLFPGPRPWNTSRLTEPAMSQTRRWLTRQLPHQRRGEERERHAQPHHQRGELRAQPVLLREDARGHHGPRRSPALSAARRPACRAPGTPPPLRLVTLAYCRRRAATGLRRRGHAGVTEDALLGGQ